MRFKSVIYYYYISHGIPRTAVTEPRFRYESSLFLLLTHCDSIRRGRTMNIRRLGDLGLKCRRFFPFKFLKMLCLGGSTGTSSLVVSEGVKGPGMS